MIGVIIQVRLGSTRLPRKVLMEIPPDSGVTVLERVVSAVLRAKLVDGYVVTTPDRELASECDRRDIRWIRWNGPRDLLAEFYAAATTFGFDPIVRITCDCPLLEPETIDTVVEAYISGMLPLAYNRCDETGGPGDGQDVEVFSFKALNEAYELAINDYDKEHVTPYIRRNNPSIVVDPPDGECCSLDTEEDYKKICSIFRRRENVR